MQGIDFVITWVDGNDSAWNAEKEKYLLLENNMFYKDSSKSRYRDWDNLQYLFRGIEKFAPWVNKIYFITWGHIPKWLNTNNSKIVIVKHDDFIPKEYLPTFNINAIENNFHRIKELSEKFVYFNDDMFIIKPVKQDDFFVNSKPVDRAILTAHCYSSKETMVMSPIVDIGIINKHFELKKVIKENYKKWFNIKYGKGNIQNLILYQCPRFSGITQYHLPAPLLKSTYYDLWNKEFELLDNTCKNKFRSLIDVNQWVYREWQIVTGNFEPGKAHMGKSFSVNKGIDDAISYINCSNGKMICINDDNISETQFKEYRNKLNIALNNLLPLKSSFEK